MKLKITTIIILMLIAGMAEAQNILKGNVEEAGRGIRLNNVFIRDINNNLLTLTDDKGNFEIRSASGHTLIFNSPGYVSDTLYVIDMTPKKVRLEQMTIALREVSITGKRAGFNPREEYPEVYQKSKVYVLSPSSWFSKDSKDARRLKRYFEMEEQQEKIDAVFNATYVSSLVPLKGQDLENFMTLYRPTYAFVKSNGGPSLAVYINDSYKKYLALTPAQRTAQQLSNN